MKSNFFAEKSSLLIITIKSFVKLFFLLLFIALTFLSNTISISKYFFANTRNLEENKNYSEIIVIIDSTTNDSFINEDFIPKPYIEYLADNEILMKWNETVKSCENMFYNSSIIHINLSNFDTSEVISMDKMFFNCPKLTEFSLSNNNLSKLKTMTEIFSN